MNSEQSVQVFPNGSFGTTQQQLHRNCAAGYQRIQLTSGNIPVQIEIYQFSFKQTCQFNNRTIVFFHGIAGA